ncbi:porin [Aliiroseovarius subalbicans]|uniref:porin n=1 Tax=Aliiroseovarius subalbicans TaxID=2925840 RepID=UPI001F5998EC|nr:porin [Aliiroseovarius subalbicans]MCI2400179.1 porin [Aliiroseovarius subalbicans]
MKKILFASTALVMTAGVAAAEVTLSGSANFGLKYNEDITASPLGDRDLWAHSEADLTIAMSGETDNGLTFGASFTVTAGASTVGAQTVWISGGFGTLSVGDVDNAIDAVVGGLADLGFDGIGIDDPAETHIGTSGAVALYEGTFGDFTVAASHNLDMTPTPLLSEWAIAAAYSFGDYTISAGVEEAGGDTLYAVGVGATFGDIAVNARYAANDTANTDSFGLNAAYTMGAVTISAGYGVDNNTGDESYGLGASYDLGGGAAIAGAVGQVNGFMVADLGVTMSF